MDVWCQHSGGDCVLVCMCPNKKYKHFHYHHSALCFVDLDYSCKPLSFLHKIFNWIALSQLILYLFFLLHIFIYCTFQLTFYFLQLSFCLSFLLHNDRHFSPIIFFFRHFNFLIFLFIQFVCLFFYLLTFFRIYTLSLLNLNLNLSRIIYIIAKPKKLFSNSKDFSQMLD